jgi:hypothetical protein
LRAGELADRAIVVTNNEITAFLGSSEIRNATISDYNAVAALERRIQEYITEVDTLNISEPEKESIKNILGDRLYYTQETLKVARTMASIEGNTRLSQSQKNNFKYQY